MTYNFSSFDTQGTESVEWLRKEYASIRTGRATPTLLDGIQVESYGTRVPLNQVGSVGIEDARTLRITPWDAGAVKEVEKALTEANLGISIVSDERGVRVVFPELTSERREQLLKLAKSKLEEARISLRGARDEVVRKLESDEKAGELSKDGKFRAKEELQKHIDTLNGELNTLYEKKESEISQ